MKQIFSYLFFRHKSLLYYKFPKINLNLIYTYYIYFSFVILSMVGSSMIFNQLHKKILNTTSACYITLFLMLSLCASGLNKAIINSNSKLNKKNDIDMLLTKPVSCKKILIMKFLETNFFTEILLISTVSIGFFIHFMHITYDWLFSLLCTFNLIIFTYAVKFSVFIHSFKGQSYFTNTVIFLLSILKLISIIFVICQFINIYNPIVSGISIIVFVYQSIMRLPLDSIAQIAISNINILFCILLLINIWFLYYVSILDRDIFQQRKLSTANRKKFKPVTFSSDKRIELNLIRLLITYIKRQKKQEIVMTYLPFISSIIGIISVCILLYIRIPHMLTQYTLMFYLVLSGVIVKNLADTYCFLSCIDIHGEKFFLFRLSGISNNKIISSQVLFNTVLNYTITILMVLCFQIFIKLSLVDIVFILFLSAIQILLFSMIYCISSISQPNFRAELITSLPSAKGKILANILIFVSFSIEALIFYFSSNQTIAFLCTIVINTIYFFVLYKLAIVKMKYLRLKRHGNQPKEN